MARVGLRGPQLNVRIFGADGNRRADGRQLGNLRGSGRAVGDVRFAGNRVGRGDADVEAGAVEQVPHRGHEPLRQQQHVEEQRAHGRHAEDAERGACRLPHEASPGEGERRDHRRASLSPPRRSSAHEAATVADGAERHRNRQAGGGDVWRDLHENQRRVVPPLEEAVDEPFGPEREEQPEERAGPGDEHALQQHLDQDSSRREANQPQHANGGAAFVDEHDR